MNDNEKDQITPARVPKEFVLNKCDYFVDVQLWPIRSKLNPERWLSNFTQDEMDHAVHLLSAFTYFSATLTKELFKAAFQKLSRLLVSPSDSYVQSEAAWERFRRSVLITHVTGETPNNTDSGHLFARWARQDLLIPESNIKAAEDVLAILLTDGPRPVVFVDDFVGSGDQFTTTWHRQVELDNNRQASFERVSSIRGTRFFYCPIVCTDYGRRVIERTCRAVSLIPAHFLSDRYSALAPDSLVWPDRLRDSAVEFLRNASQRAGLNEHRFRGYRNLGLTVGFEHCIPDATLPIFYAEENGWRPLVKRS